MLEKEQKKDGVRGSMEEEKGQGWGLNRVFCTHRGTTSSSGTSRTAGTGFSLRETGRRRRVRAHPEHSWQVTPERLPSLRDLLSLQNHAQACWEGCVREEGGEAATSPCHQGHQRGQEDRWGQSDLGHHLCQGHHQHLWDQHRPKDIRKPETSSMGQGGDLACLAGV